MALPALPVRVALLASGAVVIAAVKACVIAIVCRIRDPWDGLDGELAFIVCRWVGMGVSEPASSLDWTRRQRSCLTMAPCGPHHGAGVLSRFPPLRRRRELLCAIDSSSARD